MRDLHNTFIIMSQTLTPTAPNRKAVTNSIIDLACQSTQRTLPNFLIIIWLVVYDQSSRNHNTKPLK
jgi:hypothetical protein